MSKSSSSRSQTRGLEPARIQANVAAVIGESRLTAESLKNLSPVPIPEFGQAQAKLLLSSLFEEADHIYITYKGEKRVHGEVTETILPGASVALHKLNELLETEIFEAQPGGWLYSINPVSSKPTGKFGVVRDADCTAWRYVLVECDGLPLDQQAALLMHLPLPIKAVVSSGGRSLHAIVQVDAPDAESYRTVARGLLHRLMLLGYDHSCSNPSRMSRLPGVKRFDVAADRWRPQELLFLSENPQPKSIV